MPDSGGTPEGVKADLCLGSIDKHFAAGLAVSLSPNRQSPV